MTVLTWILAGVVVQMAVWLWLLKARIEGVTATAAHESARLAALEANVALLVDLMEQETAPPPPPEAPNRMAELDEVDKVLEARRKS